MNIPNLLTVFRILLVPVFVIVFNSNAENSALLALMIFMLAGITDLLDGYIARKFNMITRIGTMLDPLADKLMLSTVLICMAAKNYIPFWIAAVVIIKEAAMIGGGIYLYYSKDNIVIPANRYGKAATAAFYLAIILLSFNEGMLVGKIAIYIAVLMTVAAFVKYRSVAVQKMRNAPKN